MCPVLIDEDIFHPLKLLRIRRVLLDREKGSCLTTLSLELIFSWARAFGSERSGVAP
jgi:hypothetical protein